MEEIYLKLSNGYYVNLFWSSNDPCDPEVATGVISINVYDAGGSCIDGGELDVIDDTEIEDNIEDCLDLVGFELGEIEWEYIDEEEFNRIAEV